MCQDVVARAMVGALLGVLLCGCGSDQQLGRDVTRGNSEDVRDLIWSADGSEIFFISGNTVLAGASAIKAARADGSGVRMVDDTQDNYGQLWGARDGSALFFTSFTPDGGTDEVFEVLQPRKVAELAIGAGTFVASPDGRRLAFTNGRDASLVDLDGGSTQGLASGSWWSMTFSPSGDQLLMVSPTEARTIDLAGAVVQATPLALEGNWASAAWVDGAGVRILSAVSPFPFRYRIQSLTTGADLRIPVSYQIEGSAWSPDASRVALWGNDCTDSSGLSCTAYHSSLDVVDATSGETKRIADADGLGGDIAFSSDGARLAYVFANSIYVSDVP